MRLGHRPRAWLFIALPVLVLAAIGALSFGFHRTPARTLAQDDEPDTTRMVDTRGASSKEARPPWRRPALPARPRTVIKTRPVPAPVAMSSNQAQSERPKPPAAPIARGDQAHKPVRPQTVAEPQEPVPPPFVVKRRRNLSEETLQKQLARIPELDLGPVPIPSAARSTSSPEAFSRIDRNRLPDLVGLPLRSDRECVLARKQAQLLESYASEVRGAMADSERKQRGAPRGMSAFRYAFFHTDQPRSWTHPEAIPALQQILMSEDTESRSILIEFLTGNPDKKASIALAQRALFDLDPNLRKAALAALKERPKAHYLGVLLDGLRYPWPAVADHAAEALAALQARAAVPALIQILELGDPAYAFQKEVNGKPVCLVRELVRINHLRNCLLCHAPSLKESDPLRGLIPSPNQRLPSRTRRVYYQSRRGTFVRADMTYLRQDFAVLQPVENEDKWPKMQRYDYLVRVRPPTADELAEYRLKKRSAKPLSPCEQQEAVLFALRQLTGKDLGSSPTEWRKALRSR
jgi:hypothetical protein